MKVGNLVIEGENIRKMSDILYNNREESNINKLNLLLTKLNRK